MKKIEVTLNADGTVQYETQGFTGKVCQEELQKIMLNGKVTSDENKPEYYDEVPNFIKNI